MTIPDLTGVRRDEIISQMQDVPKGSPEYQRMQAALASMMPN